ncbi:hypothetical protein [Amycolatopsis sp. GA6-003]|uniref:hypothetical protein n=1 Tax=Amycolatopsis sp. GA6-003 TaxID=2652444 RepID=UPI0039172ABC
MRTAVKTLTLVAFWILFAGTALLAMGFVMLVTAPPHSGANIGAGGAFLFGMACTVGGLLIGAAAAVAWLRLPKPERRPAADLPAWQHRLRRLTAAAVALIAAGAAVQFAGVVNFMGEQADTDWTDTYAFFVAGGSISGLGLLAGIPHVAYWFSWRRTAAHLSRRA